MSNGKVEIVLRRNSESGPLTGQLGTLPPDENSPIEEVLAENARLRTFFRAGHCGNCATLQAELDRVNELLASYTHASDEDTARDIAEGRREP